MMHFKGYRRKDGKVGIRNKYLILSVDECCEGIARNIGKKFDDAVVFTNAYTCMLGGNEESFNQMKAVAEHPNIVGVLVIAMGCGSIPPESITVDLEEAGKPFAHIVVEKEKGTRNSINLGIEHINSFKEFNKDLKREDIPISELIVGVKCGGSDTSSGLTSNPVAGGTIDKLVDLGGTAIGGELFELIGCEDILKKRAKNEEVAKKIDELILREKLRWGVEGAGMETMSIGNYVGGLSTIEEKSLGAYSKMGTKEIKDVLEINHLRVDKPREKGFYLSEVTMLCGGSGVNFASLGAHIILWTTGAAGFNNAIVPVVRISGNEDLMTEDIDIDASGILTGEEDINSIVDRTLEKLIRTASGEKTAVEDLADSTLTLYQKDRRVETLICRK